MNQKCVGNTVLFVGLRNQNVRFCYGNHRRTAITVTSLQNMFQCYRTPLCRVAVKCNVSAVWIGCHPVLIDTTTVHCLWAVVGVLFPKLQPLCVYAVCCVIITLCTLWACMYSQLCAVFINWAHVQFLMKQFNCGYLCWCVVIAECNSEMCSVYLTQFWENVLFFGSRI
jgi:hypothetical protein